MISNGVDMRLLFALGFLLGGLAVHFVSRRGLAWRHRGAQSESYPALRSTVVAHLQSQGTMNTKQFETLTEVTSANARQHLEAMEQEGLIRRHRHGRTKGFYTLA